MKKIFALMMIAGTLSFVACNSEKKAEEGAATEAPMADSTSTMEAAPMEAAPADSTMKADSAKPADAAAPAEKPAEPAH
jgi:hypothetical protein